MEFGIDQATPHHASHGLLSPAMPILVSILITLWAFLPACAQIELDDTFGHAGPLSGPDYQITEDLGRTIGPNLFHSFRDFQLAATESATFSGAAAIDNIIARVTGENPSAIDGTIRSTIAGADLFFLNPNGILLGPNAALDVEGSFTASTADFVRLSDNGRFDAADPSASILTSAPPEAFGFLRAQPAPILVSGAALRVPEEKAIQFACGDLAITGGILQAPAGRVAILAGASPGEAQISGLGEADGTDDSFTEFGDLAITEDSIVDVDGEGGGTLRIHAGHIDIDASALSANTYGDLAGQDVKITATESFTVADGAAINVDTYGRGAGGNVHIRAGIMTMDGSEMDAFTGITADTVSDVGAGGSIVVETETLHILGGAALVADTYGPGPGGGIEVHADQILLDGHGTPLFTGISAESLATMEGGSAGDILVAANRLAILEGAAISADTQGDGAGGDIHVVAESILLDGKEAKLFTGIAAETLPPGVGGGGDIVVETETLRILSGAAIVADTSGDGAGGAIVVNANRVTLDGGQSLLFTGIAAHSYGVDADGISGGVTVNAGELEIIDGAAITAGTLSAGAGGDVTIAAGRVALDGANGLAGIFAESHGAGAGGDIRLDVDSLQLTHNAWISVGGAGAGDAGNIEIEANRHVTIAAFSAITASALEASGGDIYIDAGARLELRDDGRITAQANRDGGNIDLITVHTIHLVDSQISAEAGDNGGNIVIDPKHTVLDNSQIIARAIRGAGGDISITTRAFIRSAASVIDASSTFGVAGNIELLAPDMDVAGTLAVLPSNFAAAGEQLSAHCAARLPEDESSFIVIGRGGLSAAAYQFIPTLETDMRAREKPEGR